MNARDPIFLDQQRRQRSLFARRARLAVFLDGAEMGELERRGPGRYRFSYSAAGLAAGRALSFSLPPRDAVFSPSETAPFFEGLLPEGPVREAIAEKFRVSAGDGFRLLEALGADCAGAVAVLVQGESPRDGGGDVRPLEEAELEALIADLPRDPLGVGLDRDGVRLSLGGVQQKLVLVRADDGRFGQPLGGAPSTCLLKPEHGRYEDLATNEAFCMRVAAAAGLEVARTELLRIGPTDCLYVERFDRAPTADGRISRLHQEDMCQALGILPEAKYEADDGPSAAQVVALLRETGSPRAAVDVNAFVRALLVNFLLGNSDAHGKNFALLHARDGIRLAPLYDVVSTSVYPELTTRMAMSIGGVEEPGEVRLESWRRFARDAGLGGQLPGFVRRWAAATLDGAEEVRQTALAEGWHRPLLDAIVELCRERAGQLADDR